MIDAKCNLFFGACLYAVTVAHAEPLLLTGEIRAKEAQFIVVPRSSSWQQQVKWIANEGAQLKKGETAVIFDAANTQGSIQSKEAELRANVSKADEENLRLDKELFEAEHQVKQAAFALEKAKVDAQVPATHQSQFSFDEKQYQLEKAQRAYEKQSAQRDEKKRQRALAKEQQKVSAKSLFDELNQLRELLQSFEVKALTDGTLIYRQLNWNNQRLGIGASVQPGWIIAEIPNAKSLSVVAYVHEFDVDQIKVGQAVKITPDVEQAMSINGTVEHISFQSERKDDWGPAYYREIWVSHAHGDEPFQWTPGMSVRVEINP